MSTLQVDTSSPCLVTGASGYIAGVLIKELLSHGITVHGTVRDPSQVDRYQHILDLAKDSAGEVKIFRGDLMEEGSFAEAMKGCSVVFHTASPFLMHGVKDPQKELVDPAVQGTKNVLDQASKTPSVKTIVMTSSTAAIYSDATDARKAPGQKLTEEVWNTTASLEYQPYRFSKLLSEQTAWVYAGSQTQWKLVVMNPSMVMGPGIKYHPQSECFTLLRNLVGGDMAKGCLDLALGVVDVRDVAKAHVIAAFTPSARGRHILVGHNTGLWEFSEILRTNFSNYPIPNKKVPKWVTWIVGPWISPILKRRYIENNVNVKMNLDNSKARSALGMEFRPLRETLEDMTRQLIAEKGIPERDENGEIIREDGNEKGEEEDKGKETSGGPDEGDAKVESESKETEG